MQQSYFTTLRVEKNCPERKHAEPVTLFVPVSVALRLTLLVTDLSVEEPAGFAREAAIAQSWV